LADSRHLQHAPTNETINRFVAFCEANLSLLKGVHVGLAIPLADEINPSIDELRLENLRPHDLTPPSLYLFALSFFWPGTIDYQEIISPFLVPLATKVPIATYVTTYRSCSPGAQWAKTAWLLMTTID